MEDLDSLRERIEDIPNNMGSHKYPRHTNLRPLSFSDSSAGDLSSFIRRFEGRMAVMGIPCRKFHIHLQEFFVGTAICRSSWDELFPLVPTNALFILT